MNPTENFGDFIRRVRRQKNLSCADVSRQSARFGKRIAGSYVNRIENDPTRRATADRLKALAHGLGVPVEELFARAVGLASTSAVHHHLQILEAGAVV